MIPTASLAEWEALSVSHSPYCLRFQLEGELADIVPISANAKGIWDHIWFDCFLRDSLIMKGSYRTLCKYFDQPELGLRRHFKELETNGFLEKTLSYSHKKKIHIVTLRPSVPASLMGILVAKLHASCSFCEEAVRYHEAHQNGEEMSLYRDFQRDLELDYS